MFEKLQLHVLGVPPAKLRREGRCAVVFPVGERNVGEEGMSVFILYDTYVVQPRFRQRMEDLMRLPPAPPPSHLR
jgi:hypothetical protein